MQPRVARLHARDRLEAIGGPLPRVRMVEHQHARPRCLDRDRNGTEQGEVDRGHENLGLAVEPLAHDVAEPRGDDDLPERQPVRRVHGRRLAMVEALVVLHEVELPPAARRRRRDRARRLPRRREHRVAVGQGLRPPAVHPDDARPEAGEPVGPGAPQRPPERPAPSLGRHHDVDLVPPGREPVRVREDRAHPAGDAQMRTQERELHAAVRWPPLSAT